jgi:Lhr-like helicase
MKIRRKQAQQPPQMLVTTPETLQAILPGSQMRRHLKSVQYVIVDEVHDLSESKRGAQLTIALERLFEVTEHENQFQFCRLVFITWKGRKHLYGLQRGA